MIVWKNEEIVGPPLHSIVGGGTADIVGVHFALANEVLKTGTPFSAENMNRLAQKGVPRFFYYDGADVPTAPFAAAPDGVREGIVLAACFAGAVLNAEGVIYAADELGTQRLANPQNHVIERDAVLHCQVGRRAFGGVTYAGEEE